MGSICTEGDAWRRSPAQMLPCTHTIKNSSFQPNTVLHKKKITARRDTLMYLLCSKFVEIHFFNNGSHFCFKNKIMRNFCDIDELISHNNKKIIMTQHLTIMRHSSFYYEKFSLLWQAKSFSWKLFINTRH